MSKQTKHVFTVEQIQSAFDNFGEKLKMEKSDISDAWHGFMIQLMAVYGVDVTPEHCQSCKTSPCPLKDTDKDFIEAVGCAFKKDEE